MLKKHTNRFQNDQACQKLKKNARNRLDLFTKYTVNININNNV